MRIFLVVLLGLGLSLDEAIADSRVAAVPLALGAKLAPVPPFPAVCAAANASGIPLTGINPPTGGDTLAPGDSVTALVTLHERKHPPTQWLICFQATTNSTPPPTTPPPPMVLYTSTGHKFEFARSPATIRIRTLGSFLGPDNRRRKPAAFGDDHAQVGVNQDFLGLGIDRGAAAIIRWNQAGRQLGGTNFMFRFRDKPFDGARISHDQHYAAQWQITSEEERAVAGWGPALGAYFDSVQETPDLADMMWKVVDLPSLWSIVKNRGFKVNFGFDHARVAAFSPAGWGLPSAAPVYSLPAELTINQHPALALTFLVTAPRPPLLVCGGIIGFLAENPADEQNYLTLRLISAHCARQ